MFRFPFYGYQYNYPYYKYYNKQAQNMNNIHINNTDRNKNSITDSQKISNTINHNKNSNNSPVFEIFGIKLYTDDLIIIGLLFVLYQENVKDEILYIILFLLLFS